MTGSGEFRRRFLRTTWRLKSPLPVSTPDVSFTQMIAKQPLLAFPQWLALLCLSLLATTGHAANPTITDVFSADPAALVVEDTVYLYAGQDESPHGGYVMNRWLCYSSKDMKTWTSHGSPLAPKDFKWAEGEAWAAQVIEKNGKFYWYVTVEHDRTKPGKAIGVAVSDSPTGPFKDARGSALVTADMTSNGGHGFEDIDPTVITDTDGTTYLFWGNTNCFYAKLKPNMIELDGPIKQIGLPWFTEAPWLHKRGDLYYLSYAAWFPEKIAYATAPSIHGPWTYRGLLAEGAGNSNTIHQAIIEFKGQWYFVYHNGSLPGGGSFTRSVCVDYLYYNPNGAMRRVVQTTEGTSLPPNPPMTPEQVIVPEWSRLLTYGEPAAFVRHANFTGAVSPSPISPYLDSTWKTAPGLSDARGVSFQSMNFPDHFLKREGDGVNLAKNDGTEGFAVDATFLEVPGLADANWSSFRTARAPDAYLIRSGERLHVRAIKDPGDKADATFRVIKEGGSAEDLQTSQ